MIEGPPTGATESDAASAADVTALAAAVAGNTTALGTKAAAADLATAEGTISAHTGQIASLNNSYNNLGTSFYTKVFTDALLAGKQTTVADGRIGRLGDGRLVENELQSLHLCHQHTRWFDCRKRRVC